MAIAEEDFGHQELVDGGVTTLHSHPGGGVDVKSGSIISAFDGDTGTVIFGTPFIAVPHVTLSLSERGGGGDGDQILIRSLTTDLFSWKIHQGHGGQVHIWDIHWIATDASNL